MGRPRQYKSGAERQRAFRCRQEATTRRVDRGALDGLEGRLDRLQAAMWAAADAGDETARQCGAAGVETILEKLTRHFADRARASPLPPPDSKQES
jgi:hypothetical protein